MRVYFLAALVLLLSAFRLRSQGRLEKNYTMEDGLASNCIYAAFQDSKAFVWLATINGVSRFDGKEFLNFNSADGLPDNEIFDIAEDGIGRIWLSCYNGVPCYIFNNRVYTAANDPTLTVIARQGYLRFSRFRKKLILTKSISKSYEVDEQGKLTSIPVEGVYFLAFEQHLLNVLSNATGNQAKYLLLNASYQTVDSIVMDKSRIKDVFVSGPNRFVITFKQGGYAQYEIRNHKIHCLHVVAESPNIRALFYTGGGLWMMSDSMGLQELNPDLQRLHVHSFVFKNQPLQHFMVDRQGNYWGCSSSKGLFMSPNNGFTYYQMPQSFLFNDLLALASHERKLYLGCTNSLLQITEPRGVLTSRLHYSGKLVDLYVDSSHLILATTQHLMMLSRDGSLRQKLAFENIKCIQRASEQVAYFGTHSGCFRWTFPNTIEPMHSGRTVAVYPRSNGEVLIGTLYGLIRAKQDLSGNWQEDTVRSPDFLKNTGIACLAEMGEVILVGTTQRGLVLLKNGDYERVKLGAGFNNINCKRIFIDRTNTIWLATYNGLFRIRLGASIHSYTVEPIRKFNGLLSDDVNDVCVIDDTVYVAASRGISIFPLRDNSDVRAKAPSLCLNSLRVAGVNYDLKAEPIRLPDDSNSLDIHVSAIDHRSVGHVLFKYRLQGMQKSWQYSTKNNIRFEALPPGDYTLEVMAMNAANVWTPEPLRLEIEIKPAWWQSYWFLALIIVVGSALIYAMVRRRLLKIHRDQIRRNIFQRHLAELELRAIKAQINPHFIFNTLNVIQYFINNQENEKAEESLNRMADLLRKTLDYSDQTTVPLTAEVNYLLNYLELEKLRFDEQVIFTVRNNVPANKLTVEIPPMVVQPHVENALRHGFANKRQGLKKLEVLFELEDDFLLCEIKDNGVGRNAAAQNKPNEKHRSRGMELSLSKLKMYEAITGKSIRTEVSDNHDEPNGRGTIIRIFIKQ